MLLVVLMTETLAQEIAEPGCKRFGRTTRIQGAVYSASSPRRTGTRFRRMACKSAENIMASDTHLTTSRRVMETSVKLCILHFEWK